MSSEATLGLQWSDSSWIPILNAANVLDYFSERSNPFYDRTCNNEVVKMQRLNPEQLNNMTGLEYIVLHAQEPILYIIRKQNRLTPDHVVPMIDYYIIGGKVYQAPDVSSVLNSRLLNTTHVLQSAFEQAQSYARYHPSKGYSWEFKEKEQTAEQANTKEKKKDESSSVFQRQRVDILLGELSRKFPPRVAAAPTHEKTAEEVKEVDVKTETPEERNPTAFQNGGKPPPEKKPKLMR